MSLKALQEIARTLDKVGEDIWDCDDRDNVFDDILRSVSRLEAQLHVQRSLQRTAKLLREQTRDTALPNQMATRVKHLIKFSFEKASRGKERSTRLRGLECNTLKFCGLAYKLKDVLELPATHFDFLIANAGSFVHRHELLQYLYRDDIDKAVNSKFDPEDDAIFKEFLKSHVEHRPAKRKRVEDSDGQRIVYPNIAMQLLPGSQASRFTTAQHSVSQGTDSLPKRSTAVPSPTLWQQQQNSITPTTQSIPTTQSFQLDGLRSGLDNESQHDHVLVRDQNYSNITGHYQVTDERPSKRPRLTPQLKFPGESQYYYFCFMRRHMVENLPEPFRTGMKTSNLWCEEAQRGGLAITNGLSMYLPEAHTHDAYFVLRLGYYEGFKLFNLFGLGDDEV